MANKLPCLQGIASEFELIDIPLSDASSFHRAGLSIDDKLLNIDVESIEGLSNSEAQAILKRDGYNELPSAKKRSTLKIAIWPPAKVLEVVRKIYRQANTRI